MTASLATPARPDSGSAAETRLRAVAAVLLAETTPAGEPVPEVPREVGTLVDSLVRAVRRDLRPEHVWLLLTAVTARFPEPEDLRDACRRLELAEDDIDATLWLLERPEHGDTRGWGLELVEGGVVVDVDFTARHDLHTGIQRVVRSTVPHWARTRDVLAVVWTGESSAYRRWAPDEADRVLRWGGGTDEPAAVDLAAAADGTTPATAEDADPATPPGPDAPPTVVVPWRSHVVLVEVPPRSATARLAALGQYTGSRIVGIGYDCIPVVSGLLVPPGEPDKFVDYLSVVKHMTHVAAISSSATLEFRGYTDMLAAQGLTGPVVTECALPADSAPAPAAGPGVPSVLCVGSFEPRKNQAAVLFAAEVLWREGLQFGLRFVGGGGWGNTFRRELARLKRRGRPVEQLTAISEAELEAEYAAARFTVFVSVHEGYGLPVAESFAHGVPALVTGYGSVAEIGEAGGVLTVDPRDDDAVVDGMRRLLTDDALLGALREQVTARPATTWTDYADQLWAQLVGDARA